MTFKEFLNVISMEPEYERNNYKTPGQDARKAVQKNYRTRNLGQLSKSHLQSKAYQSPQAKDFWMQPGKQVPTLLFPLPTKQQIDRRPNKRKKMS